MTRRDEIAALVERLRSYAGTCTGLEPRQIITEAANRLERLSFQPSAAEQQAAFLIALGEAGIEPDIQELLVQGNPSRGIAPGALGKAIAILALPPAAEREGVARRSSAPPFAEIQNAEALPQENIMTKAPQTAREWAELIADQYCLPDSTTHALEEAVNRGMRISNDESARNALAASPPQSPDAERACGHCGGVGDIDDGDHPCMACGGTGRRAALAQPDTAAIREALEQAAGWFEEYAKEHYAKAKTAPDGREQHGREVKGKTNADRAKVLRAALPTTLAASPPQSPGAATPGDPQ